MVVVLLTHLIGVNKLTLLPHRRWISAEVLAHDWLPDVD